MARPPKFRPDLAGATLVLARGGMSRERIARELGISRRTLQNWLARGRAQEEPFAAWAGAFDEAVVAARRRRLQSGNQRQQSEAKARWQKFKAARSRWWLDRLGPEEFILRRLLWIANRRR
jgi:transposase